MNDSQFDREQRAYDALNDVFDAAKAARQLFEDASLSIPPPLARMLGEVSPRDNGAAGSMRQMPVPPRPPGADATWVWIKSKDLRPVTLVKGILRAKGGSARPKHILADVQQWRPDISGTVVYNVGPRLEASKLMAKREGQWVLLDETTAPILHKDYAWGPTNVFQTQELASFRRDCILHLLNEFSGGLQMMQIVEHLAQNTELRVPKSKDLVKADMAVLQEGKLVRRISNSKKWGLIPQAATGE